jgi:ribonucleoside-diphosphate reductase alpha chain
MSNKKYSNLNVQAAVRRKWAWERDIKDKKMKHKKLGFLVAYGAREEEGLENGKIEEFKNGEMSKRYFVELDRGTELDGIRRSLFLDRYSLKNENGEPMEMFPEQMWRRVSKALSQKEETPELQKEWEERFFVAMQNFRFCPAGRFLTSAGTGTETTMINCFVIPNPEDTREGIINTLKQVTEISARGGGVGFNLSTLRPRGSYLKSINGTSSGAVSWANIYSVAAHDIIQQGGTRRGALMMMLWDWHPDVEEFITVKKEQGKILGANLSVCISDAFMEAVSGDGDWELKFPDTGFEKYRSEWSGDMKEWIDKGYPVKTYKTVKARELWDLICESAWASAEPGTVFMDRYNEMNNTWYFEQNIATNPCGEQGLPAWGVCNLSSINLSALVTAKQNGEMEFDWDDYKELIRVGVRFLDNAVDGENYLYPEIEKTQKRERRLGLGTLGLADALIKMKIRYGSDESLILIDKIYKTLRDVAYEYSVELAKEKGAFSMFEADKYLESGFMKTMPEQIRKQIRAFGIRNALVLTEAPTGKIALLAGASSGIEPVFSFSYEQKDRLGERTMYHPLYEKWLESQNLEVEDIPDYFVTADDLTPSEHVKIQALIQKYTDSSISKTVNAPEAHTMKDVKELYRLAYETGCKGISYMREGSREGTLVRNQKLNIKNQKEGVASQQIDEGNGLRDKSLAWVRPTKVSGATYKLNTPMGRAFITVNHDEGGSPVEVFINIGRAGSDIQAMAEALGRLISKVLKMGSSLSTKERAMVMIDQLSGISSGRSVGFGSRRISSLPDAVAKTLAMDMGLIGFDNQKSEVGIQNSESSSEEISLQLSIANNDELVVPVAASKQLGVKTADICPDCGNATLVHEMGCKTCHGCGYSEC